MAKNGVLVCLCFLLLATASSCITFDDIQKVFGLQYSDTPNSIVAISHKSNEDQQQQQEVRHYSTYEQDQWPIDISMYEGHVVFRIQYEDDFTRRCIVKIVKQLSDIDIWAKSVTKKFIDIRFKTKKSVNEFQNLIGTADDLKYDISPLILDLPQAVFETFDIETSPSASMEDTSLSITSDLFFKSYRPLKTIYAWMEILAQSYPDLVTIEWVGQTYEGRDLKAVHVRSSDSNNKNSERKTVVITGGLHAREWLSVSSTCFILNELLLRYEEGRTKEVFYLNNLDFLFVPVMNPDGYEYTWTTDRLWRKNRQETYLPRCFGVDIDHSFDFHWQHSDDLPCGEDYSGEDSFESIESEVWNSYLNKTKSELKIYGYIDLHSYAQEVLYPYAYSCDQRPRDSENLIELAYGLSKAIRLKSGKHYDVLSACRDKDVDLMPSLGSGSALDYMYHNRAFWAFQIKLRDSGSHGFLLPAKYIAPVGKEIFSSIRYFCNFVLNND